MKVVGKESVPVSLYQSRMELELSFGFKRNLEDYQGWLYIKEGKSNVVSLFTTSE
jgi:hypothetical protein